MRLLTAVFLLIPLSSLSAGQSGGSGEIRVLIQADDMGVFHGINVGTIRAYKEGIVRATNIIVPGQWLLEAVKLVNENPGLDVGVHLAITSEWPFAKWRPLTQVPTLIDPNGYFFPGVPRNTAGVDPAKKVEDVERELRAQIDMLRRLVPRVNYVSTHMGLESVLPDTAPVVRKLAKEYGLQFCGGEPDVQSIGGVFGSGRGAPPETGEVKAEKLAKRLETLGPGTWRMIEHASVNDPEMEAISPQNVGAVREAVMQAWISPRVQEVVRRRNIKLIGYRDLVK